MLIQLAPASRAQVVRSHATGITKHACDFQSPKTKKNSLGTAVPVAARHLRSPTLDDVLAPDGTSRIATGDALLGDIPTTDYLSRCKS